MALRKELSEFDRGLIIGAWKFNNSASKISAQLNFPLGTVKSIINRYIKGIISNGPRSGRPRKTNWLQDRSITKRATQNLKNRRKTLDQITTSFNQVNRVRISSRTTRRLREKGVKSCVPKEVPVTNENTRAARLLYCQKMLDWSENKLNRIIYSDECRISLEGPDSYRRVWRRSKERFDPACIKATPQNLPGLMVWSCCNAGGLGPIVIIDGHINGQSYSELLENVLMPTIGAMFEDPRDAVFQHDNAPAHRSLAASTKLAELDICTIEWPPYSPDLNPIESLWHLLKRRIWARPNPPTTLPDLRVAILEEWAELARREEEWIGHLQHSHTHGGSPDSKRISH